MAEILDGGLVARQIFSEIKSLVEQIEAKGSETKLAIVVGTDDKSMITYVNRLTKKAGELGISAGIIRPDTNTTEDYQNILKKLSNDPKVHGIILQTPLPKGIDLSAINTFIPVKKDVDGINPTSAGRLLAGQKAFAPATAQAVLQILDHYKIEILSKKAVVVGRSMIVGKPVASLLINRDATVTICHSKTQNLAEITKEADILVAAIGKANYITDQYVDDNCVVIDVGTNFDENGKMTGDVDFNSVEGIVSGISPVPGGVGPITTALLLKHTCEAALSDL